MRLRMESRVVAWERDYTWSGLGTRLRMEWPGNEATHGVAWERGYAWSGLGTRLRMEWPGNEATHGVAWERGYAWSTWPGNEATHGVAWERGYTWSGLGTRLHMEWPGNEATHGVAWERGYTWSGLGTRLHMEWPGNEATHGVAWERGYTWSFRSCGTYMYIQVRSSLGLGLQNLACPRRLHHTHHLSSMWWSFGTCLEQQNPDLRIFGGQFPLGRKPHPHQGFIQDFTLEGGHFLGDSKHMYAKQTLCKSRPPRGAALRLNPVGFGS